MTMEKRTVEFDAYRDSKGNPCCAGDFPTGKVCVLYRTLHFGCMETCAAMPDMKCLLRRDCNGVHDIGSLIPFAGCPIWKGV